MTHGAIIPLDFNPARMDVELTTHLSFETTHLILRGERSEIEHFLSKLADACQQAAEKLDGPL